MSGQMTDPSPSPSRETLSRFANLSWPELVVAARANGIDDSTIIFRELCSIWGAEFANRYRMGELRVMQRNFPYSVEVFITRLGFNLIVEPDQIIKSTSAIENVESQSRRRFSDTLRMLVEQSLMSSEEANDIAVRTSGLDFPNEQRRLDALLAESKPRSRPGFDLSPYFVSPQDINPSDEVEVPGFQEWERAKEQKESTLITPARSTNSGLAFAYRDIENFPQVTYKMLTDMIRESQMYPDEMIVALDNEFAVQHGMYNLDKFKAGDMFFAFGILVEKGVKTVMLSFKGIAAAGTPAIKITRFGQKLVFKSYQQRQEYREAERYLEMQAVREAGQSVQVKVMKQDLNPTRKVQVD